MANTSARITCIHCGRPLGIEEGWEYLCPLCRQKRNQKKENKESKKGE